MQEFIIRKATQQDLSVIYYMVYELAVFEKEPEALKISINEYEEAFKENLFESIVAEQNGKIIGITVFYMTFSTWRGKCLYLEDFYVKQEFRNLGVGQKLFDAFVSESKSKGARMVKWQVLDWNQVGLNFYIQNNAIIEKNWWNGKLYFDK